MAIELVDFPINSMVIFHSYVKLPEGKYYEPNIHITYLSGLTWLISWWTVASHVTDITPLSIHIQLVMVIYGEYPL